MKVKLYAIRDKKAGTYNAPCVFDNDAVAIRAFGDVVLKSDGNLIASHPSDFQIVALGSFDRESGALVQSVEDIIVLADGDAFVKESK